MIPYLPELVIIVLVGPLSGDLFICLLKECQPPHPFASGVPHDRFPERESIGE